MPWRQKTWNATLGVAWTSEISKLTSSDCFLKQDHTYFYKATPCNSATPFGPTGPWSFSPPQIGHSIFILCQCYSLQIVSGPFWLSRKRICIRRDFPKVKCSLVYVGWRCGQVFKGLILLTFYCSWQVRFSYED